MYFLLVFLPMKKFAVFLFLVATIFLSACCSGSKKTDSSLKVATFNLRLAPKPDSSMWQDRKEACADLILYHGLEIVGTQEGYLHQLNDLTKLTGYKFTGVGREDGKSGGEHSAILYNPARFALLDAGDFWFSETPDKPVKGWDAMCKRVCSWAKFKDNKTDKEFYFFSLHYDHKGKIARNESSKLLPKKIREISKGATFFCVGDFNATEDSEPMNLLSADDSIQDSKKVSKTKPYGTNGTFHAFTGIPKYPRIDYILTSKNVDVLSYAVITDKLSRFDEKIDKTKKKQTQYPSDHFPVAIDAVIK